MNKSNYFTYNVLNLPQTALMGDGSRIEWSYSAAGGKLSERIFDENGGFLSRTDYVADAIFDDRGPDRIQLPEGYVTMCDFFSAEASDGLVFHAYVPDYQGNILRVVNTSTGQIEQATDYYPYGMPHVDATGAEVNRIKFGGKELVTNRGLNAADFSARWHAVALGRFTTPDPCAETYPDLSPYIFCASNPVNFSDPTGREWRFVHEDDMSFICCTSNYSFSGISTFYSSLIKRVINICFNKMISEVSNNTYGGYFNFVNDGNINQLLILEAFNDNSIGGSTIKMTSSVNTYNSKGDLKSPLEIAYDIIHEILHTLRINHPFEDGELNDTQLIKVAPNDYITTSTTDPNITNNVMNYPSITINGAHPQQFNALTSDQFYKILQEIILQQQGYGKIPPYNPELTPTENENNANELYNNYWQ